MNREDYSQRINFPQRKQVYGTNTLDLAVSQKYVFPNPYFGYISFQVTSSSVTDTITLETSIDRETWVTATDANDNELTYSLSPSTPVLEKLGAVPPGTLFRLSFTVSSGEVEISYVA